MKQLVLWKPLLCKTIDGTEVRIDVAGELDVRYRGTLLNQIMKMPEKKPLTLNDATRLLHKALDKAFDAQQFHDQRDGYHWYYKHFISWISELGYHIELTGDEFEPLVISSKVS